MRTSLIVGTVLVTSCAFALASVAIYRAATNTLIANLDDEMGEDVRLVASTVRTANGRILLEFRDLDIQEYTSGSGPGYLELYLDDGSVLYRSPSLAGADLDPHPGAQTEPVSFAWLRTPRGSRARTVGMRFEVQPGDPDEIAREGIALPGSLHPPFFVRVVAAMEPTDEDAFLTGLKIALFTVSILTGLAAAVLLAFVIRSSLRPLNALAGRIEALDEDDLSTRVHLPTVPVEIEGVVRHLNQLLSRVETAFQRERTFSADIAHELRTPMSGLRSTIEVALSRRRGVDDYCATLEDAHEIVCRVQTMVETLLYLGRLESSQVDIERSTVDVRDVIATAWKLIEPAALNRNLSVEWNLPQAVSIVTDPLLLEIAVRNVLENAVIYANEGGYVRVAAEETDGATMLRVVNSGSQIAPEDAPELLRRFRRGDASRKETGEHAGLGLSIASKIAAALHASMRVESNLGGEFAVTFSFESERERAII